LIPNGRALLVERVHSALRPVVRRAQDKGVTLVIENIEDKDPNIRVELAHSFDRLSASRWTLGTPTTRTTASALRQVEDGPANTPLL
jgi:hypothetical protein